MADIRAKFYVAEVTRFPGPIETAGGRVKCQAVSRGAVNRSFASATPVGTIELVVTNPAALVKYDEWRDQRREFYVDFTEYTPTAGDGHDFVNTEGDSHFNRGRCVECGGEQDAH